MRTPSTLAQRTSWSTSASVEVLRKRFDGWWSDVYFLYSVGSCFMLSFVVAEDSDYLGGTPVKMTSAQVVSLRRHIASEVESSAVDPILSSKYFYVPFVFDFIEFILFSSFVSSTHFC